MTKQGDGAGGPKKVVVPAVAPRASMDDDRPTEVHAIHGHDAGPRLVESREQVIRGSTVREIMTNREHKLSTALYTLLRRAREDLPDAELDARTELKLRHDFEFDRRVGYFLKLVVFDAAGKCVEVVAELDQDGRQIRRGSVFSKLLF
ncbi:hypothetical protein L6R52_29255 [Myxococcota bacterium]|nr:hypothetical protein [Myxococcota bacterium]